VNAGRLGCPPTPMVATMVLVAVARTRIVPPDESLRYTWVPSGRTRSAGWKPSGTWLVTVLVAASSTISAVLLAV
jgi:hypothetical protein